MASSRFRIVLILAALVWIFPAAARGGQTSSPSLDLSTGAAVYQAACVGCHGPGGRGMPDTTVAFEKPSTFPDFSACDQTTPELDVDWKATIRQGGRARGFSRIMPAFGDALTEKQIDMVVGYLRGLCSERSWPRGELNLPRPLATEKAFPEDETVITTAVNATTRHDVANELVYEHRLSARNQIEVSIPFAVSHDESGSTAAGIGDIGFGLKRVLASSIERGSILSVQGEAIAPTGDHARGLGSGTTVFEAFAAFGQILPAESFVQLQGGTEQPVDTDKTPRAVFARGAFGKSFRADRGNGRLWTPMIELVLDRDLVTGAHTNVDLLPQFQVTLSARQHVRANVGFQVPVANTSGRPVQVVFYFLWDWFDGGLLQGWK